MYCINTIRVERPCCSSNKPYLPFPLIFDDLFQSFFLWNNWNQSGFKIKNINAPWSFLWEFVYLLHLLHWNQFFFVCWPIFPRWHGWYHKLSSEFFGFGILLVKLAQVIVNCQFRNCALVLNRRLSIFFMEIERKKMEVSISVYFYIFRNEHWI